MPELWKDIQGVQAKVEALEELFCLSPVVRSLSAYLTCAPLDSLKLPGTRSEARYCCEAPPEHSTTAAPASSQECTGLGLGLRQDVVKKLLQGSLVCCCPT